MADLLFPIQITPSAERDLLAGFEFYETQSTGLGDYFLDNLISDIDSLCICAGTHYKSHSNFYRLLSKRFPFAIYYEFDGATAYVVAILDCRQNPNTIQKRLSI